jgi:hypothetical protein
MTSRRPGIPDLCHHGLLLDDVVVGELKLCVGCGERRQGSTPGERGGGERGCEEGRRSSGAAGLQQRGGEADARLGREGRSNDDLQGGGLVE